jgi:hypothetical protein
MGGYAANAGEHIAALRSAASEKNKGPDSRQGLRLLWAQSKNKGELCPMQDQTTTTKGQSETTGQSHSASLYRTKWIMAHNWLHAVVHDPSLSLPLIWDKYLKELESAENKEYWETEVSCGSDFGPSGCEDAFTTDMTTDGLMWAGLIDDRMVNANANAYLYWLMINFDVNDNEGLMSYSGVIAKRAYVFGQCSKFIRPGYYRIDATHNPQSGVTVSAYKNPIGAGNFAIVATNYNSSNATVSFTLDNFTADSVTPWLTSSTSNLTAQASITVSGSSFNATLPAQSVTTFVGTVLSPPTNVKAVPH